MAGKETEKTEELKDLTVRVFIPPDPNGKDKYVVAFVNHKPYKVERGKVAEVTAPVYFAIQNSNVGASAV
jgi:hypothetical protein